MHTLFATRLARHAMEAQAPAMVMEEREIGFADLLRDVESCAAWLRREGCAQAPVVGITIADEYAHMVVSLGLLWLGIAQVGLPSHDPPAMRQRLAQRLAVGRIIVAEPRHAIEGFETSLLVPEFLRATAQALPPAAVAVDPDAPAIYFSSSGTTGEPKLLALSQRIFAWRAERMTENEGVVPGYRALVPVSVEHAPGKSKRLISAYMGLTTVFKPAAASPPRSLPALCAQFKVTCLELSTLHATSLVHEHSGDNRFPACTTVHASASRVPAELRRAFKARFAMPLFVHYGTREFGRISRTYPDRHDDAQESVGAVAPWVDLEIVDGDGKALPTGAVGEVRVRTENMIRGYHDDPVATARHFRDGWFYTGDAGSLTADGALCLQGRTDDMMNLNSIKIFPAEIERVLEEHPAVKGAAAFAKVSAVHGDIPVAAVELHQGATVGVDELMARAREHLGARAPRKIIIVDALPRNAAGKIVKRDLVGRIGPDK